MNEQSQTHLHDCACQWCKGKITPSQEQWETTQKAAQEPALTEEADVWHEGSKSFYRAKLLHKLTPGEVFSGPPELDVYTKPAQEVTMTDGAVNAAAKVLAERFDYPWEHMPEQGRNSMRETVRAVVIATLREKEQVK